MNMLEFCPWCGHTLNAHRIDKDNIRRCNVCDQGAASNPLDKPCEVGGILAC